MQQFQPGMARAMVRACLVLKKSIKPVRIGWSTRVRMSSHATRAQSGLCRPIWVSLRACKLHLPCAMHTGCARPAGSSRLASGTPPPVACACVASVIVRSDRGHRPERPPLAARSRYPGISCMSADPRAPGRPWATAGATVESHVARLGKFAPPMCSVHSRLGEGMACDSCSQLLGS